MKIYEPAKADHFASPEVSNDPFFAWFYVVFLCMASMEM